MKKILVLYHTDLDGAMSAAVVGMRHRNDEITYRLYNYGWEIRPEELQGYDIIYAVDVSFFQGGYDWVYRTPGLISIDHHIGAIKKEMSAEYEWMRNVPGLRVSDDVRAACELTWDYLFPGYQKPVLLEYLSAYDIWNKSRFPWNDVEEVEFGAKHVFGLNPQDIISFIDQGRSLDELRGIGRIILENLEKKNKSLLRNNGFYIHDFFGYRVMALNTTELSSMTFQTFWNPGFFDIMMPFSIVPGINLGEAMVRVSFYTEKPEIDVSLIAEKFGGSGHKGAAGCTMDLETLQQLISCSGPLKSYLETVGFKGNKAKRV